MLRCLTGCAALLVFLGADAKAQQVAERMTCAQAIDYFAKNKVIYKMVGGAPLPIRVGKPIQSASTLDCRGRGRMQRRYMVKTIDAPRCAVSLYCQ